MRLRRATLLWTLAKASTPQRWARIGSVTRSRIARYATVAAVVAIVGSNALIGLETFLLVQLAYSGGQLTVATTLGAPNFSAAIFAVVVGIVINVALGLLVLRPQLKWFVSCTPADHERRRAVRRIPRNQVFSTMIAWSVAVFCYAIAADDLTGNTLLGVAGAFLLAGLSSGCLTYLFAERAARPLAVAALQDYQSTRVVHGVRGRMVAVWAVSSAVPMLGLIIVNIGRWRGLLPHAVGSVDWTTVVLALVGLAAGSRVIFLVGGAITDPLTEMQRAIEKVNRGRLDARVPVYDSSELGVLQLGFNNMVDGLAERERMREIFARHVGDTVAEHAMERGIGMHGTNANVGVLFVDIVGSSAIAQRQGPDKTAALLNSFFGIVADVVDQHSGFVNKFEGDAALAVFGAPVALANPAAAVLAAARDLAGRLADNLEIRCGIGVSYGESFAGNIGAERRYEYTVIGDAVNESARLSDMAKSGRISVLASGAAIHAAGSEAQEWQLLGTRVMRGRSEPTEVFGPVEVIARTPSDGLLAGLFRPARRIVGNPIRLPLS